MFLQDKLTFQGFKLIVGGKINRKAIIDYIRHLLGGRDQTWSICKGYGNDDFSREEPNYTVTDVSGTGAYIITSAREQGYFIAFEVMGDNLLVKTLWNLCYLQRQMTLKQERVVRDAFQSVYQSNDESELPVLGVELVALTVASYNSLVSR